MKKSATAIVTGAAGFIGSHMVDLLLSQGYQVRGLDNLFSGKLQNLTQHAGNPDFVFEECDLINLSSCMDCFKGADYVFHFAGIADIVPSIEKPVDYMAVNVMGTINALEASRANNIKKFIYTASSSCYGITDDLPTSESSKIDLQHPYALSKSMGETAALNWGRVYGIPIISLRIFNAYGPRSRTTGAYGAVFGVFLAQKLANKPFTVVGDGTQSRDFVYVTDVVDAFLKAAQSTRKNEIYNIGGGNPQTINRLVELLDGSVSYLPKRPGEPDCTWADISKIRNHLDWIPKVTFEDGVSAMLNQIEDWSDAPVWDYESIKSATENWFLSLSDKT